MHKKRSDKSKKKYSRTGFISYQTAQISQLISEGNYTLAKKIIFELLEDYSTDEILLKKLARIYILEKNYTEAETILEQLKEENNFNRLISIYIKLNEEEKLYRLYKKYYSENLSMEDRTLNNISYSVQIYLRKRFEPNYIRSYKEDAYLNRQLYNYSEKEALDHINQVHISAKDDGKTQFLSDINLEQLYYSTKKYIDNNLDKGQNCTIIADRYYFYLPACGVNIDGSTLDHYMVKTIVNTSQIITMYPCKSKKNIEVCQIENEKEKQPEKVKVKTGLERYYAKYNK